MPVKQRVREPRVRRWTVKEFYRLGGLGAFHPEERLELIDGVIYKMPRISPPHATVVQLGYQSLKAAFGPENHVRTQLPIHLGTRSEPIPDITAVMGGPRDYCEAHPTTALLLVEIGDKTLTFDRRRKDSLYARAGIDDYWIVNLKKRQLEVYRNPVADATHYSGHRYAGTTVLTDQDAVTPLAAPNARIAVADLLP